jgi:outer membrane protein TolC
MRRRISWVLLALTWTVWPLGKPAVAADVAEEGTVWEPPRLEAETIGLMNAVRLTLQYEPTLRIQEEQSRFSLGLFQEQRGRFDRTLLGSLFAEYRQEELRQSQKKIEQQRRDDAEQAALDFQEVRVELDEDLETLRALEGDPTGVKFDDPFVQAQIDVLNALIDLADELDAKQEFTELRDELIDTMIANTEALRDEFLEAEVEAFEKLEALGEIPDIDENYLGSLRLEFAIPYRSGLTLTPFFELSFEGTQYQGKDRDLEKGGKGIEDVWRNDIGFRVDLPLIKGRGKESAAAFETAAEIDYRASLSALQHAASTSVFVTTLSYWNLVAAQQQVDILEQSVSLQGQLVELTQALIDGDQIPRAELARVRAREAELVANLHEAMRSRHEARLTLARSIGLVVDDERNAPLAADGFPEVASEETFSGLEPQSLTATAVSQRNDLEAAKLTEDSGAVLVKAAQIDLGDRLDLLADLSFVAVGETSLGELDRWVGPSLSVGLTWEKPFGNNVARGQLLQRRAVYNQSGIVVRDLERIIRANVVSALGELQEAAAAVMQAEEAVRYYRETIQSEMDRYRLGSATLIDTIQTEQRLTDALLAETFAELRYASLLARLRFETGTLVTETPDGGEVREEDLRSLPQSGPLGARP